MTKKLWEKGLETDRLIEQFTVGKDRELDLDLAEHEIRGTMAHIKMLESIGLLEKKELNELLKELNKLLELAENGSFVIEEGVEDVHSQVELMLTRKLGDIGKKVHAGRSRNDQVMLDLRLYFRDQIQQIKGLVSDLFGVLINQSNRHRDVLMPGYTHTQAAMPSSFGLWFGAYAEGLSDDLVMLKAAHDLVNRNPLGSAAGYGSSFPLDREMTTDLLEFDGLNVNAVYAQMGRGKTEQVLASAMALLAGTLNKLAADVCLYNSQNFSFIELPPELTTGSSIMPHKKNPDVFELIRAKSNRIQTLPEQVRSVTANMTSGYHRDFQVLKEIMMPALEELKQCLHITAYAAERIKVKEDLLDDARYRMIFSVERVNELVKEGLPFRDAYRQVAEEVEKGQLEKPDSLDHTHTGSLGNPGNELISSRMQKLLDRF